MQVNVQIILNLHHTNIKIYNRQSMTNDILIILCYKTEVLFTNYSIVPSGCCGVYKHLQS